MLSSLFADALDVILHNRFLVKVNLEIEGHRQHQNEIDGASATSIRSSHMCLDASCTVQELKGLIQQHYGIPRSNQKVYLSTATEKNQGPDKNEAEIFHGPIMTCITTTATIRIVEFVEDPRVVSLFDMAAPLDEAHLRDQIMAALAKPRLPQHCDCGKRLGVQYLSEPKRCTFCLWFLDEQISYCSTCCFGSCERCLDQDIGREGALNPRTLLLVKVLRTVQNGFFACDHDGYRYEYSNESLQKYLYYSLQDTFGLETYEAFPSLEHAATENSIALEDVAISHEEEDDEDSEDEDSLHAFLHTILPAKPRQKSANSKQKIALKQEAPLPEIFPSPKILHDGVLLTVRLSGELEAMVDNFHTDSQKRAARGILEVTKLPLPNGMTAEHMRRGLQRRMDHASGLWKFVVDFRKKQHAQATDTNHITLVKFKLAVKAVSYTIDEAVLNLVMEYYGQTT